MSSTIKNMIVTGPRDSKNFPATNQAHFCWQKYNEFVLCMKKSSGDEEACTLPRAIARSVCVDEWVESWDEQRAKGKFLGIQENPKPAASHH